MVRFRGDTAPWPVVSTQLITFVDTPGYAIRMPVLFVGVQSVVPDFVGETACRPLPVPGRTSRSHGNPRRSRLLSGQTLRDRIWRQAMVTGSRLLSRVLLALLVVQGGTCTPRGDPCQAYVRRRLEQNVPVAVDASITTTNRAVSCTQAYAINTGRLNCPAHRTTGADPDAQNEP